MSQTFILPRAMPRDRMLERIGQFLAGLSPDKAWKLEVCEHRRKRSDQQNAYLWGVCYATLLKADALHGWDADDLHEYFLGEHFGWERLEGMGRVRLQPIRRSSKLTVTEFGDFVDFIHRKAAEFGVYIPEPGEMA